MTDWTLLSNTAVGVGGLPSGATVTALRDNPIAISEGAVGAPRVLDAALDTTATTAGVNWVTARSAGIAGVIGGYSTGAVGTYAFLAFVSSLNFPVAGTLYAGSSLRYAGMDQSTLHVSAVAPGGTWRAVGTGSSAVQASATVFLRVS
jgi:hypothetical protein